MNENRSEMSVRIKTALFAIVIVSGLCSCGGGKNPSGTESAEASVGDTLELNEFGIPVAGYEVETKQVGRGDFFSNILNEYGITNQEIYRISEAIKDTFDIRDIRIGNEYSAYLSEADSSLGYWVYEIDRSSNLVLDMNAPDSAMARIFRKEMEVVPRYADVTIENSLWYDMVSAGVSPLLIIKLSDIYAWTVDFFALQKGDVFRVLYDEVVCGGEVFEIGDVKYVFGDVRPGGRRQYLLE